MAVELVVVDDESFSSWSHEINDMYLSYMEKLRPYNPDLEGNVTAVEAARNVREYFEEENSDLVVFCDGDELLGFAFICHIPGKWALHSENEVYIEEFYVDRPGEGVGGEALRQITERYGDNYWFYVLEGNPAKDFWVHIMEKYGFESIDVSDPAEYLFPASNAIFDFMYWRRKTAK